MKNIATTEVGKGLISLANIIGGLSIVNIFLQNTKNYFYLLIVAYIVIMLYIIGYRLIKRSQI